jgi:hypothetical protein
MVFFRLNLMQNALISNGIILKKLSLYEDHVSRLSVVQLL